MPRYNHLVCIAFSLRTNSPTVEGATPGEIIAALTDRLYYLNQDWTLNNAESFTDLLEDLGDTYMEDE